jgi:hypothetical protein
MPPTSYKIEVRLAKPWCLLFLYKDFDPFLFSQPKPPSMQNCKLITDVGLEILSDYCDNMLELNLGYVVSRQGRGRFEALCRAAYRAHQQHITIVQSRCAPINLKRGCGVMICGVE